jgi:hypothetical protein
MTIETTRRAVLAGAPAIALVATIPGTLKAAPADNATWERVKADYLAACLRFNVAQDAYTRADSEQIDFSETAPERELTYSDEGFRIVTDGMRVEAQPSDRQFLLTHRNYASEAAAAALKDAPEYAAFIAEMEAWEASREAQSEARGWDAAEQEWEDAHDAQTAAWAALISCPVETVEQVEEKLTLARKVVIEEVEAGELMDAINADLTRITPH